ncbi:hypothetical protein BH09PSE5_BH09PSE5_36840 [soil metagenome]
MLEGLVYAGYICPWLAPEPMDPAITRADIITREAGLGAMLPTEEDAIVTQYLIEARDQLATLGVTVNGVRITGSLAGKTTLMRTIAGLLRTREGRIELAGSAIDRVAPDAIVKAGLCMVPEGRRVFAPLSVADNLELGAYTRLRRSEPIAEDLDRIYTIFPRLKERAAQLAGTLSRRSRSCIAREPVCCWPNRTLAWRFPWPATPTSSSRAWW